METPSEPRVPKNRPFRPSTMYTIPNPYYRHSNWIRSGAEFAGIMIAGRCILAMAFFSFGILLMGIVMTVVAQCFRAPHLKDPAFKDSDKTNPVKVLGPVFLGIGGLLFVVSIVLLVIAIKSAKRSLVGIADGADIATANSLDGLGPPNMPYFPPPEEPYGNYGYGPSYPFSSKQPYSATYVGGQTVMGEPLAPAYPPTCSSFNFASITK